MFFLKNKSRLIITSMIILVLAIICSGSSFAMSNDGSGITFEVSDYSKVVNDIVSSGSDQGVQYEGMTLSRAQVLYILTKSVSVIGSTGNDDGSFKVGTYNNAPHPRGDDYYQSISKSQYLDMSNRFSTWIEVHNQVPNFVGINEAGVPDISPSVMESICIKVLSNYEKSGQLPGSVSTF